MWEGGGGQQNQGGAAERRRDQGGVADGGGGWSQQVVQQRVGGVEEAVGHPVHGPGSTHRTCRTGPYQTHSTCSLRVGLVRVLPLSPVILSSTSVSLLSVVLHPALLVLVRDVLRAAAASH